MSQLNFVTDYPTMDDDRFNDDNESTDNEKAVGY